MRTDSAVTGEKRSYGATGAPVDLDYRTLAAKYIHLATVETSFRRHWSISKRFVASSVQEMLDVLNLSGKEQNTELNCICTLLCEN